MAVAIEDLLKIERHKGLPINVRPNFDGLHDSQVIEDVVYVVAIQANMVEAKEGINFVYENGRHTRRKVYDEWPKLTKKLTMISKESRAMSWKLILIQEKS